MVKRSNEDWLADLRSDGEIREAALTDLRKQIAAGLPFALSRWLPPDDPRFSALADEVTQDTILRVLDHLDSFEGRSQFITWVYKIAVRVALTELRRTKWREVSLDEMLEGQDAQDQPQEIADQDAAVENSVEKRETLTLLNRVMTEALTVKQRQALTAIAIEGLPLEDVARRMGTEKNALYKLIHDARIKLKSYLEKQGVSSTELIAPFEEK
ncbi:MAG: RNA polymerase sigma factor [Anaerolineae bacterium]|nr:RNA polymerase sigma factor [Anaerolineae bacterium]